MSSLFRADYTIQKVFNNNVLLVTQKKKEKILFGKGLGFGKHLGEILSSDTKIDKVFSLDDKTNYNNFRELVTTVDDESIDIIKKQYSDSYSLAEKVCKLIENELHLDVVDDEVAYIAVHIEKLKNPC